MSLIHDIENLPVDELQSRRTELVESLRASPPDDLVPRYLQARIDAKVRDDKLADQAKTLDALRCGLEAGEAQYASLKVDGELLIADGARLQQSVDDSIAEGRQLDAAHAEEIAGWDATVKLKEADTEAIRVALRDALAEKASQIQAINGRCERLKEQARQSAVNWANAQQATTRALAEVQALITKSQATAELDQADRDEG